jgi:hypothetical protein
VCVCMYVCMYVCVCMCICMYMYVRKYLGEADNYHLSYDGMMAVCLYDDMIVKWLYGCVMAV